jgi:spermidine/putrescine transport system permease protein
MKKNGIKSLIKSETPYFLMMPAIVWQVLFFYIPIAIIIGLSFTKHGISFWQNITLANYGSLFEWPYFKIIFRSLIFAFSNALVCLIFAYPVAYFLARKVKKFQNVMLFFLILPFWTNILVQIYAWFFVLERNGLLNSILLKLGMIQEPLHMLNSMPSIFLVMCYCYLPFMIMPLFTTLEKIDERLIESSYDLGANSWQTFFKVTLPLSWPGIKTGFFLVFVPSFGEFVIPALVGGSKTMFVGSLISHYFLVAQDPHTGAAFTIMSGCILLLIVLMLNWYFSKKAGLTKGS